MTTPPPRSISDAEARIAAEQYRRAGLYTEIAPDDVTLASRVEFPNSWPSRRQQQSYPDDTVGASSITAVSVCRMGDMREALAVVSGDGATVGTHDPNIVTVRIQNAAEGFGYPHLAFQTASTIRDVCLVSSYNPILNVNALATEDKVLMLCVWYGNDPNSATSVLVSTNYGQTWTVVWSSATGRIRQPRLTQGPDGKTYLFFRDSNDDTLRFYYTSLLPSDWPASFAWDNAGGATLLWSLVDGDTPTVFDMTHDGECWVYGGNYAASTTYHVVVKLNTSVAPDGGTWISSNTTSFTSASPVINWLRTGRTGRYGEFGNSPSGAVFQVVRINGNMFYSVFDTDIPGATITPRLESFLGIYRSPDNWQDINGGFYWTWGQAGPLAAVNNLANKEIWGSILTPSTSVIYENDTDSQPCVTIDTHGPTGGDHDTVDIFPGFWTHSNELSSVAFPPYNPDRDVDIYFRFHPTRREYHNVWFVIDDPTHPERPVFKADFYTGNAPSSGHPHDNARGLAMWFCREQWDNHPYKDNPTGARGVPALPYEHPLQEMFRGFDNPDDNMRIWQFWIHYDHAADTFELQWNPDGIGYEPFIPYAVSHPADQREYVDIGTADSYVASSTEKYHIQPRNGLWPRRFYFGCPEQKPAIQEQSTMRVGPMQVVTDVSSANINPLYPVSLIPRLSGGLDLWYAESDVLYRQTAGHGWQDVYTLTSVHSDAALAAGPDQAEIVLQNSDNYHSTLYDNLRHYHVMVWAKSGSRTRQLTTPFAEGGEWGGWRCLFFGTSDTGEPLDSENGPTITMRAYSPLRDLSRSSRSQGFTSTEPPSVKTGHTDTNTPDVKKMREWALLFMRDFHHPADLSKPVDSKGRLMRYEDYITRVAWEDLLGNDPAKLNLESVKFTPSNFTLNQSGKSADMLDDLRNLWSMLGLIPWYDYDVDVLRVWLRDSFGVSNNPLTPEITLNARAMIAVPLSQQETDYSKTGNVSVTTSNIESRPNQSVARVSPWPDNADTTEQGVDAISGEASQSGTAEAYRYSMALNLLTTQWEQAKQLTIPLAAFPYVRHGMIVQLSLDSDLPLVLKQRYAPIERAWWVNKVETDGGPDHLTSTVTLVPVEPFPS